MVKKGTKAEKCFILDTNVLIHNPKSIYSFSDNRVIIPITVIEELDRFKSLSDKKGMHSRQVLREIDSLIKKGALKKGAKMKNHGTLWIAVGPKKPMIVNMDISQNDNKILSVALDLQKSGAMVFFISKDLNARIKAEALGIKARDYEKQKVAYSSLYAGWKEITVKKEVIDEIYREGKISLKGQNFFLNEYALLKAEGDPKASAICRYDEQEEILEPLKESKDVMGIRPRNMQQRFAFDLLLNPRIKLITLVGQAGSGKTLISLACGLNLTIDKNPTFEKLLVARPVIPLGKDIGYLPGDKDAKLNFWMQPIFDNLSFLLKMAGKEKDLMQGSSEETMQYLLKSKMIEIEALTYIRGRSIPDQFLIVDEAQNLTPHEVKTIISRAGEGTKIIMTGDPDQIDNPYLDADSNGLTYTVESLKGKRLFGHVLLTKSERSELASMAAEDL